MQGLMDKAESIVAERMASAPLSYNRAVEQEDA